MVEPPELEVDDRAAGHYPNGNHANCSHRRGEIHPAQMREVVTVHHSLAWSLDTFESVAFEVKSVLKSERDKAMRKDFRAGEVSGTLAPSSRYNSQPILNCGLPGGTARGPEGA